MPTECNSQDLHANLKPLGYVLLLIVCSFGTAGTGQVSRAEASTFDSYLRRLACLTRMWARKWVSC